MKILIIVAVLILITSIVRQLLGQYGKRHPNKTKAEDVVKCEHCGLFVLHREAIIAGGRFYCCEDHRHAEQRS